MTVTIKDIAKLANVSHTTVSRALNDSPLIHEDTKKRIQDIARSLNYTPNFSAKSLVLARSYRIGLFFSTMGSGTSSGFFHEAVKGAHGVLRDRYQLIVNAIDDYRENYAAITPRTFDGVIVMSQSHRDEPFIRHVNAQGIPLILLNRSIEDLPVASVVSDDRDGVRRMTEHMIAQGHRRIAIIEGKEGFRSSESRLEGYLQAMRAAGLDTPPCYRVKGHYDLGSGYDAMRSLLDCVPRPTAVFCSSDEMAVGAMKAIAERGLRIPQHISVAGFDDDVFSAFLSPALTTVKRPVETMSRQGAELLLELIADPGRPQASVRVETELALRESVGTGIQADAGTAPNETSN